jgi:amino acid transporter
VCLDTCSGYGRNLTLFGTGMVWGWALASFFILFIGMSMAELGSAAPTSGGVGALYYICTFLPSNRTS